MSGKGKYYVYHLIDPRDGSVFYVGKGTGDRYKHHERDAARLRFANSEKEWRIHDIWSCGEKVRRKKVKEFSSESAALDFERPEIDRIGIENLTNISNGGEPAANKAQKRAMAFIEKHTRALPLLDENYKMIAKGLIEEMKENLFACNKQLTGI